MEAMPTAIQCELFSCGKTCFNATAAAAAAGSRDQWHRVLGQRWHCTRLQQADQHVLLEACHLQGQGSDIQIA